MPLFAGIYTRGAGIGPATTFLYSGPAVNVLAITLTAKILGWRLGITRAVGAILFSILTGMLMALIFKEDDANRSAGQIYTPDENDSGRSLAQEVLYVGTMVLILIFAALAKPAEGAEGFWAAVYAAKWHITVILMIILGVMIKAWFTVEERKDWVEATWDFMKQIFPLLAGGVLIAGFMLGRPGHSALIQAHYIEFFVGENSIGANLAASLAGALMYFATLTEVPIL